jgi:hypothetical protein
VVLSAGAQATSPAPASSAARRREERIPEA